MSIWTTATVAAKNAVLAPMKVTKASASGAYSKTGDMRATRNTPAVTMVAAWISAETGVGPSIASGSQVCRPSWADLPMAPMNSRKATTSSAWKLWPNATISVSFRRSALAKITSNWTLSNTTNAAAIPSMKPKSPTRLTTNALIAAAQAEGLVYQKPISRYDASPTPSQPKKSCTRLSELTSISMKNVNIDK